MTVNNELCLVTGATGFIAGHIVEKLLLKGYRVRGTVRSLKNKEKYSHLSEMKGAADRLELVQADILELDTIERATEGIDICFHVASPFILDVKDAKKDLWEPAVYGALNVLKSCQKNKVKQVIMTSSMAAVADCPKPYLLTELNWNDESSLTRNPYFFSKAESEKAAWKYYESLEEPSFKLVTILPFLTIGPSHTKNLNAGMPGLLGMMMGKVPKFPDTHSSMVSVVDVAEAHILAAENPDSKGRYIVANDSLDAAEIDKIMEEEFPEFKKSTFTMPLFLIKMISYLLPVGTGSMIRSNFGKGKWSISHEKVEKELGLQLKPPRDCIIDQVNDFIRWGHISK